MVRSLHCAMEPGETVRRFGRDDDFFGLRERSGCGSIQVNFQLSGPFLPSCTSAGSVPLGGSRGSRFALQLDLVGFDDRCNQSRKAFVDLSTSRRVVHLNATARSPRTRPASRRALKCCDSVDFGMVFSLMVEKVVQFRGQSWPTISAKIATRTGSDRAWRMASTVTFSTEG